MASKKTLLKVDIEIRWKILIIVKEVLKFAAYFAEPSTPLEQYYVRRDRHLTFIGWALWRLAVIELCKLFSDSDNQKFNIIKLLRKISPGGDYGSLKFNEDELKNFNDRAEHLQLAIIEITNLRNTLYAHTDKDPFSQVETFVGTSDCFALVEFAEDVIRTLAGTFLNTDYIANTLYYDSRPFDFIDILAKVELNEQKAIADMNGMSYKELFGHEPLA